MTTSHAGRRLAGGGGGGRDSWDVQLERLAAAFELTVAEVQQDWALVHDPVDGQPLDVFEQLRVRHAWDASVAPYYVKWLKGGPSGL